MEGLKKPTVTSIIIGGHRRLAYVFDDGKEIIEQYDIRTHEMLLRKIKKPSTFKQSKWEIEAGDQEANHKNDPQLMIKSTTAPIFIRKDTMESFQWRIRNLPYPEQVYLLEVDSQKQQVIIKTTIKKYYKRFQIPDLLRSNIKLSKDNLSFKYNNNTLVVSYKKPEFLLAKQIEMRKQFERMNLKKPKQGDIQCTTQ